MADEKKTEVEEEEIEVQVEKEPEEEEVEAKAPDEEEVELKAEDEVPDKTKKRISKLLKDRREAQDRATLAEQKIQEFEGRLAEVEAEKRQVEVNAVKKFAKGAEAQLSGIKREMQTAFEANDYERITELQGQLTDAKIALKEAEYAESGEEQPKAKRAQEVVPQVPKPDPLALEWAQKHSEWFGPDQVMTSVALAVDATMQNEGWDPSGDEYYVEIDRRLKEELPHKFKVASQVKKSPVAGVSRSGKNVRQVRLSSSELDMAERLGVSPESYAREKADPGSTLRARRT